MSAFLFIFLAPFLRYLYPKVSSSSAASKGTFNPLLTIKKQNAILSFHLLNEKGKRLMTLRPHLRPIITEVSLLQVSVLSRRGEA